LPKLPGRRYAAVVFTAFLSAAVVALGAGALIPDDLTGFNKKQYVAIQDGLISADNSLRQENQGGSVVVDPNKPDVWLMPLHWKYEITTYNEMRWGTMHWGVDMAAPEGTPIYATHDGTIIIAGENGGYGLCTEIDNGNGIITIYGHASALLTVRGQKVHAGDEIARVGTTGFSTGDHLHYEIKVNGGEYDPIVFMKERGVDLQTRFEGATGITYPVAGG